MATNRVRVIVLSDIPQRLGDIRLGDNVRTIGGTAFGVVTGFSTDGYVEFSHTSADGTVSNYAELPFNLEWAE